MAKVCIHLGNRHFHAQCRAFMQEYEHEIVDSGQVHMAIIDLDYGNPPPISADKYVFISVKDRSQVDIPADALFWRLPVDMETLLDYLLNMLV